MKVVDLADEFGLTTSEAIDACLWAGVPVDSAATNLTSDDADRVRGLVAGWIDAGFAPWSQAAGVRPGPPQGAASGAAAGTTAVGAATSTLPPAGARAPGAGPEPGGGGGANGLTGAALPSRGAASGGGTATATMPSPTVIGEGPPRPAPGAEPGTNGAGEADETFDGTRGPILPPPGGGPTGWLPGGPDASVRIATLAVVALALAITSLVIPFITAIIAIILASVAKDRIEDSRGWLRGDKIATTAQVVAGIGIGLWIVAVGFAFVRAGETNTVEDVVQPTDLQVDVREIAYLDLKPGDCVRLPEVGEVSTWMLVECGSQHDAQAVAKLIAGNPIGQPYPGDGPIQETAKRDCRAKLAEYIGTPNDQTLELGYSYPSRRTWSGDEKERVMYCVAFRKDGSKLAGSLQNNAP